jgi:hypothetical protein
MAVLTSFVFRVVPKMNLVRTPQERALTCSATLAVMSRSITADPDAVLVRRRVVACTGHFLILHGELPTGDFVREN